MELPIRKNIRLNGYDYSQNGAYFITICVKNRHCLFGEINNGKMTLNQIGNIANENIIAIKEHITGVEVANHIVMPNHIHMILLLNSQTVGTRYIVSEIKEQDIVEQNNIHENMRTPYMASLQEKSKQIVSKTIQQFKASVSRQTKIAGLWQPRFHDHIIRNQHEYQLIWQYIDTNPLQWEEDCFYVKL